MSSECTGKLDFVYESLTLPDQGKISFGKADTWNLKRMMGVRTYGNAPGARAMIHFL
jgi:hypothetical protein